MQLAVKGLVSGVGSLPYKDAASALKLIQENVPAAPHWPQLPLAGENEGFSVQYLQALVKIGLLKTDHGLYFDENDPDWVTKITEFYELFLAAQDGDAAALAQFAFPEDAARGFYAFLKDLQENGTRQAVYLKGQLSGPLTVGFEVKDLNKRAAYYNPQLRDILIKNLTMHAIWQARTLRRFGLPVILIVDEPGLYAFGMSTHVTLQREELINNLNEILTAIQGEGVCAGVHVCAGMDWTLLFDTEVQIINFDAYDYFDSMKVYASELKSYLQRGGVISWGIVPTSAKILEESAENLSEVLKKDFADLETRGIPHALLATQSMFTPSCGTGTLNSESAEKVYQTLAKLGSLVKTWL